MPSARVSVRETIRLAVLECDTPISQTIRQYGGWTGLLEKRLQDVLAEHANPPKLSVTGHQVKTDLKSYPRIEDIDALVVTGSRSDPNENHPWIMELLRFISQVLADRQQSISVIGFCFGHQIVGRALGCALDPVADGMSAGVREFKLSPQGRDTFATRSSTLEVPEMHNVGVFSPPAWSSAERVRVLGTSEKGAIEGFNIPGKLLTLQCHPEFDDCILSDVIQYGAINNLLDSKAVVDGLNSIDKAERNGSAGDSYLIWQAIVRLLMGKD